MARLTTRSAATREQTLQPFLRTCALCARPMWTTYSNQRTVTTLEGRISSVPFS